MFNETKRDPDQILDAKIKTDTKLLRPKLIPRPQFWPGDQSRIEIDILASRWRSSEMTYSVSSGT